MAVFTAAAPTVAAQAQAQIQTPSPSVQRAAATALRARYAALQEQPRTVFQQPLYLQSDETSDHTSGDVYALVNHPYAEVRQALDRVESWCGILILHLNVKYCRPTMASGAEALTVAIGRKHDQPLANAYWLQLDFRVAHAGADYLQLLMQAPTGPLSTRDYRIVVEAAAVDAGHSVLHMTYAYAYGSGAHWAMQAYLATFARDKVGFSVLGQRSDGQPAYVDGVRGVMERNTLRYYLAIDAYLDACSLPASQRLQKSLEDWFAATERYPRQLHEMERKAYLDMKLSEARRQEQQVITPRKN